MAGEGAFKVGGVVTEARANGTYRVRLPNGHDVVGFVAGRARRSHARLQPGAPVRLQMSPCDLSQGRILTEEKACGKEQNI